MLGSNSFLYLQRLALGLSLLFVSEAAQTGAAERSAPSALRSQIDSAIARVKPALVRIRVVSTDYSEGREVKMQEVGSGAIITRDGYLITNHHVAGHAARMFCTMWNREEIEAELVGTDPLTDISILKLKPEQPIEFTPAELRRFLQNPGGRVRAGDGQPHGPLPIGNARHHQQHRNDHAAVLGFGPAYSNGR